MKHAEYVPAALFLLFFSSLAGAQTLGVEKYTDNRDVKVGDDVTISLKFTNPFGKDLPVRIVDRNVFGGNGIDIQCMEYTVPARETSAISYSPPVKPYSSGNYTLDAASVTYTNPSSGTEETVKSNTINISVAPSAAWSGGQTEGITTVYRCNGISMQSTSFSSFGSLQQQNRQDQQNGNRMDDRQTQVQNNQMNQNLNALRQEMQRQQEEQSRMEEAFRNNLENNPEFQRQQQELEKQGYKPADSRLNPTANDSGLFEKNYKKDNGENASIKGEMKDGKISGMQTQSSENTRNVMEALQQNAAFQKYDGMMKNAGLSKMQPQVVQTAANTSKITVPYMNQTTGETRNITADYVNGTIKNVSLQKEDEVRDNNMLLIIAVIVVLLAAGYLAYHKYAAKKRKPSKTPAPKEHFNYRKEAIEMINQAEKLFSSGCEKDAYGKVSEAVRFYYSHKLGLKKEITAYELLEELRKEKLTEYGDVKECLNLCGLVEFAKYRANKEDFEAIVSSARKVVT